ncbi:carbohydrate ABC transporter permease [Actinoallomurus rhizosphaericola]|uniref:carbohydrate ABC transporter permease n=1 Tax=Actinoallomurus rhizosphaericola TaxID=2952536 RepID=UPI00209054F5|nr:sugar ABC transporter permease [Actinoallomurus rhizosphaericola]MCO5992852.1 sugar ABC transporter permease [Actinoallomurus rhizosphaericola]
MGTTSVDAAGSGPAVATAADRPRHRERERRRAAAPRGDGRIALLFLAPALLGFAVFYVYPAIRGAYYSTTDYNLLSPPRGVGVANYTALVHDPLFWNALKVTGYYVVLNIVSQTVLALVLAALMFRLTRSVVVRAMLLVPWLVPNVTVGLLFLWLFDADLGLVNHLMSAAGLGTHGWFSSTTWAMPTIALTNTWAYTGYTALLLYAGMLQIPGQVYEAAMLDGASELRMFFRLTLPLMRPVLALVLVVSVIGSFQMFDTVAITPTHGGPVNATRVIYYYIYELAFTHFRMGYASAAAMSLVLILGALTLLQMRLLRASRSDLA